VSDTNVVRVGVATIVRRRDSILMGLRKGARGAGTWSFPGGHLEVGETLTGCASRELLEETGIGVRRQNLERFGFTNDIFEEEGKHYITIYFETHYVETQEPRIMEPNKCSAWDWVRREDVPGLSLFLPIQNLLKDGMDPWRTK
jgi:8-oxo-dGTP diphosphatase